MMYCKYCGKELKDDEMCECKNSLNIKIDYKSILGKVKDYTEMIINNHIEFDHFERNKQIIPECVKPDNGEVVIKQYKIAKLRSLIKGMFAEGSLQVTNKRVIFRATGVSPLGKLITQQEFAINEISGVEFKKNQRFSFLNFIIIFTLFMCIGNTVTYAFEYFSNINQVLSIILAFALTFFSLAYFVLIKDKSITKMLLLSISLGAISAIGTEKMYYIIAMPTDWLIGTVLVVLELLFYVFLFQASFIPNLIVLIKTKGASSPIEIRRKELHFFSKIADQEYTGFSDVMPWDDTITASEELGAMINDLNTLGDMGIEKWKEK